MLQSAARRLDFTAPASIYTTGQTGRFRSDRCRTTFCRLILKIPYSSIESYLKLNAAVLEVSIKVYNVEVALWCHRLHKEASEPADQPAKGHVPSEGEPK